MRFWVGLGLMLGHNLQRHVTGKPTWCSSTRRHVDADTFDAAWDLLSEAMKRHYRAGFP